MLISFEEQINCLSVIEEIKNDEYPNERFVGWKTYPPHLHYPVHTDDSVR